MGESIWCNVQFRVPVGWSDHVENLWSWMAEMTDDVNDTIAWINLSGEGNYGLEDGNWSGLLNWLEEFHVPYIADSEPKYEIPGFRQIFDGHQIVSGESDGDGAILTQWMWESIWRNVVETDGSVAEAIDEFFKRLNRSIVEFNIDHLQPFPPPDPDEMLDEFACALGGVDFTLRQIGAT